MNFTLSPPPCTPNRRGTPPSCDLDAVDASGFPLIPPPTLNRNPRLPSPSNSTSSYNTPHNLDWFSQGDISEIDSSFEASGSRSQSNSPAKKVPPVIGTVDIGRKHGAGSPPLVRGRSPAPSPRARTLIEKRRRRFVEHRRAQSIDGSSLISPARSNNSSLKSSPNSDNSSLKGSPAKSVGCSLKGSNSTCSLKWSGNTSTKASTPDRSDSSTVKTNSSSPSAKSYSSSPAKSPALSSAKSYSSSPAARSRAASPAKSCTSDQGSVSANVAALQAWKKNAIKEHAARIEAFEKTVLKHASVAEDLRREAEGSAAKYAMDVEELRSQIEEQQKDINKKKTEIKELEDMVIWSETTLASKLDALNEEVKAKDIEIFNLKAKLVTLNSSNDIRATEIDELKSWKAVAETDMEQLGKESMTIGRENREWKGKLAICENRLQSKTVECMALAEKLSKHDEKLEQLHSQLQAKETEVTDRQKQHDAKVNEYECTIAEMMADIAKTAELHSAKITQLESEISSKTKECLNASKALSNYRAHLTESSNEISNMCTKLLARKREIADLHERIIENDGKYEQTLAALTKENSKESEVYSERIGRLECDLLTRDSRIEELEQDVSSLEANLKSAIKDLDESDVKVNEFKAELAKCKEDLQSEKDKACSLSQELSENKEESVNKQAKIEQHENKIKTLESQIVAYQTNIESEKKTAALLSKELLQTKEQCAASDAKIIEHETTIQNLNHEVVTLRADIESRRMKHCLLSQDLTDTNERYISACGHITELDTQITLLENRIAAKAAEIAETKRNLEMRDESILSLEGSINLKEEQISKLHADLSTAKANFEQLEKQLQESKEDFKIQLIAERLARVEEIKNLQSSLSKKDDEIMQYKADMKMSATKVTNMDSKVVSLQLLSDALVTERDELRQWKFEAEKKMKVQELKLDEVTSKSDALCEECHDLREQVKERHVLEEKFDLETRAVSKLEESTIEKIKENELLKVEISALQRKISKLQSQDMGKYLEAAEKVKVLEAFKHMAKAKLELNDGEISTLVIQNAQLSVKIDELEKDMGRQRAKFLMAQQAIQGLEETLVAVEGSRMKLMREKDVVEEEHQKLLREIEAADDSSATTSVDDNSSTSSSDSGTSTSSGSSLSSEEG